MPHKDPERAKKYRRNRRAQDPEKFRKYSREYYRDSKNGKVRIRKKAREDYKRDRTKDIERARDERRRDKEIVVMFNIIAVHNQRLRVEANMSRTEAVKLQVRAIQNRWKLKG